jgi:hypothetical protein
METRDDILKELREVAPELAKLGKTELYKAPENYFLNFSAGILERVKTKEVREELTVLAPALSKFKEETPAAPSNYFTTFSSSLLDKIRAEEVSKELEEMAPTLHGLQKLNLHKAPHGYFASFPTEIQKQITAGEARPESAVPGWLSQLNALLDSVVSVIFKPQYTFAFAGSAAMVMIVAMMFFKVEPIVEECAKDDLLCKLDKVSSADLEAYFATHTDEFNRSVLDVSVDDKRLQKAVGVSSGSMDEVLLNSISDEELNSVVLD